jgi:hypothetical protein
MSDEQRRSYGRTGVPLLPVLRKTEQPISVSDSFPREAFYGALVGGLLGYIGLEASGQYWLVPWLLGVGAIAAIGIALEWWHRHNTGTERSSIRKWVTGVSVAASMIIALLVIWGVGHHSNFQGSVPAATLAPVQPPLYFLRARIIAQKVDPEHYIMSAQIVLGNDSVEGRGEFVAAEFLHANLYHRIPESAIPKDVAHVNAMAAKPAPAPTPEPRIINRAGITTIVETPDLTVTTPMYIQFTKGYGVFYFAGSMAYTIDGHQGVLPFCAYSVGDPNTVLQC